MTRRKRKTTCANPDCRRPCYPRSRGLCDSCLLEYRRGRDAQRRGTRERAHYSAGWRERSKRAISEHVAVHGYRCPGYTTPDRRTCPGAHPETNPLALDHVVARDGSEVQVLCRVCNGRKGAR